MPTEAIVRANLVAVRSRIDRAADHASRDVAAITLVAVSKTFTAEAVVAACAAGQVDFGENRVQEAADKIPLVTTHGSSPVWHLIGHLQTNKVKAAIELFGMIHTIDSVRLAESVNARLSAALPVLLEVNVAEEATKGGFAPDELVEAVRAVRALSNLDLRGLMTVAPAVADPEDVRPVFRRLAVMARELGLPELSMGMSADFEVAIEEGATIIRVGSAIFGHRDT